MALTLTSPAFKQQGEIPKRYTCEGADTSPPLSTDCLGGDQAIFAYQYWIWFAKLPI